PSIVFTSVPAEEQPAPDGPLRKIAIEQHLLVRGGLLRVPVGGAESAPSGETNVVGGAGADRVDARIDLHRVPACPVDGERYGRRLRDLVGVGRIDRGRRRS